jgi:hypothetical protein
MSALRYTLALACTLLPVGAASAQSSLSLALFANPDVARTLGLTQNQVNSLRDTAACLRQDLEDQLAQIKDLRGNERARRLREIHDQYDAHWGKKAAGVLTPRQMERYRQLELQARGPEAFMDAGVQKKLNLTAQQRQKLEALRQRYQRQRSELGQGSRGGKDEAAYRKQFFQEANAILDVGQRRSWRELIGEDFNFTPKAPYSSNR